MAEAPVAPGAGSTDPLPGPSPPQPTAAAPALGPRRSMSLSLSRSSAPRSARAPILSPNTGKPCLVCFDRIKDGVECELGHFTCRGCLQGFVRNLEPLQIRRSGGCISCPGVSPDGQEPCEAAPWDYDDLADLLDEKTQRIYVSRLQGLLASVLSSASLQLQQQQPAGDSEDGRRMSMTMSRHHRRRSSQTLRWSLGKTGTRGLSLAASIGGSLAPRDEASEATLEEEEELRWHRAQIDEDILTLTCPREGCHKAFLDFDGCYALTCPGCGCGFCAACLLDCGDDAHDHCRRVHQGYFGTVEAFHVAQRARRLAAVAAYLHSLLLPPSPPPTSSSSSSSSSSEASAAASSPVFLPAVAAARSPEQAAALVEGLLTGPLSKDLAEVGIAVEDVRRALANSSNSGGDSSSSSSSDNTGPNEATRLLGARDDEGAAGGGVPIRLHYTHEAAHQHCRRLLDGPGYAPEDDALGRWLGSALTGSSMVAAVWWLAGEHSEPSGTVPLVLAALVVGPAGVLLGTGRGQQVVQALYVTLLAAGLCTPVYLWGWQLFSWSFVAFFRVLLLLGHALGFAVDATVEGLRTMRGVGRGASQELGEVYAVVRRVAPWLEVWLDHLAAMLARAAQRGVHALDVVGLRPPEDAAIPAANA